jgi:molybdopterin-guanine dinucleotide biosynthesis protein A
MRLLAGRPLLDHAIDRIRPQVTALTLNANGDPARFAAWGLPVLMDTSPDYPGPLAGILAGMEWAAETYPSIPDIVSVPADAPFLPRDLVNRLESARADAQAEIAIAASGERTHPVVGLWPVRLAAALRRAMTADGIRRAQEFAERYGLALARYAAQPVDPFFNVNDAVALAEGERLISAGLSVWG